MRIKFVLKENIPCVNKHEFHHKLNQMTANAENNIMSLGILCSTQTVFEIEVSRMTIELFLLLKDHVEVIDVTDICEDTVKSEETYQYLITGSNCCLHEILKSKVFKPCLASMGYSRDNGLARITLKGPWLSDLLISYLLASEANVKVVPLDNADTPWDARIHTGSKSKTAIGMWKKKKGFAVSPDLTEPTMDESGELFRKWISEKIDSVEKGSMTIQEALKSIVFPDSTVKAGGDLSSRALFGVDVNGRVTGVDVTATGLTGSVEKGCMTFQEALKSIEFRVEKAQLAKSIYDPELFGVVEFKNGSVDWDRYNEFQAVKAKMAKEDHVKAQRRERRKELVNKQAKLIDWVCSMAPNHDFTGAGFTIYQNEVGQFVYADDIQPDVGTPTFPKTIAIDVCEKLNSGGLSF
jgi:hypothetical protein